MAEKSAWLYLLYTGGKRRHDIERLIVCDRDEILPSITQHQIVVAIVLYKSRQPYICKVHALIGAFGIIR